MDKLSLSHIGLQSLLVERTEPFSSEEKIYFRIKSKGWQRFVKNKLGVSVSERTACGSNNSSMTELTQKALELDFKSGSLRIKLHLYIDSNKRV